MSTKVGEWTRYTPAVAQQADIDWLLDGTYQKVAKWLSPLMEKHEIRSVVEFGCGSGLLAGTFPLTVRYLGLDASAELLQLAKARSGSHLIREFGIYNVQAQVHPEIALPEPHGLVVFWSLLKHLPLDDWDYLVGLLLGCGTFAAFNVQLFDKDLDNGTDWPHVFVTEEHLQRVLKAADFKILERHAWGEGDVAGGRMVDAVIFGKRG